MPTAQQKAIGIYLFGLPDKDQAIIQRVITFGATQGKNYIIEADLDNARIAISLDNIELPSNHAVSIRIGDSNLPCDLLLQRPLLVTRVMRALDDATQILKSKPMTAEIPLPNTVEETDTAPPPQQPERAPEPEVPFPKEEKTVTDGYAYTALVVDDSAAIRKQLEIELRDAHIKAEFAETGEEALEKSAWKQYDLIFLDIIMPGIDGFEVCRQMRARKTMKKTPIIMLSGKTSPLDEVQGVIAGASTYLTKPVKHEQFQQTLKRVSKWLTNFAC